MNNKLKELRNQMRNIDKEVEPFKKEKYKINKEYIELLQEECKENIGRCFKKIKKGKVIAYCKIINIDTAYTTMTNDIHFNAYQYPAIWFDYPYESQNKNNSIPFRIENIFSGAWGKGHDLIDKINEIIYEEISPKEYMDKFLEINTVWTNKVNEI